MIYLVAAETVLLVLMTVLVAGLLRSHAEILRRLPAERPGAGDDDALPELQLSSPPAREEGSFPAHDVSGYTLQSDAVKVGLTAGAPHTLVAFLSSGCATCQDFWEALRPAHREPLPGGARLLVVTKDSAHESPSKLRELAPPDVAVVMSSAAWEDYSVPAAPYFVYVGSNGRVLGEGAASNWSQIMSLFRDALLDAGIDDSRPERDGATARGTPGSRGRRGGERIRAEDRTFAAAGIRPGHPSLYPGHEQDGERD